MKLILPKNIFTSIFVETIDKNHNFEIEFLESSLIAKALDANTSAVALIPSLELINHRNLFVSSKIGISFEGSLSNSYFHFNKEGKNFSKIYLRGDVSINEVLLAKIIFSELYSTDIDIVLDTSKTVETNKDYLVAGDENFSNWDYENAMSISEEVAEFIDLPYVNFIFVSMDKESLEKFNKILDQADTKVEEILNSMKLRNELKSFLLSNFNSLHFNITKHEIDAVEELLKLIYYRGFIDDLFDIKFI